MGVRHTAHKGKEITSHTFAFINYYINDYSVPESEINPEVVNVNYTMAMIVICLKTSW